MEASTLFKPLQVVCSWLVNCSHVFTIFAKKHACEEKMLSIRLQALAISSMYLSTYLPSSIIIKKQPQRNKKGNNLWQNYIAHGWSFAY